MPRKPKTPKRPHGPRRPPQSRPGRSSKPKKPKKDKPKKPKKDTMAEFAVAAQDFNTGYQRLDIIDVLPDGVVWGTLDLADVANGKMWIIKVSGLSVELARLAVRELWEPARPPEEGDPMGDSEWFSPDPGDRRIHRGRRAVKAFIDELPPPKRNELAATGIITLTRGQANSIYRKVEWNRNTDQIEDTGIGEFG